VTPFALLEQLAGLSHREAAEFHRVRLDSVKKWSTGDTRCPPGALAELRALIATQERAAREALAIIGGDDPDEIEIGHPADDAEARALGWPCVGAWSAMAARVLAAIDRPAMLVPRGSTPATAVAIGEAAEPQRGKNRRN
jgi:hypothetical protein